MANGDMMYLRMYCRSIIINVLIYVFDLRSRIWNCYFGIYVFDQIHRYNIIVKVVGSSQYSSQFFEVFDFPIFDLKLAEQNFRIILSLRNLYVSKTV